MSGTETRARKKIGSTWDLHRSTIETLYQTKQLEGDDGVMGLMEREQGFRASKAQYEYQLKKWGLRKYRKRKQRQFNPNPAPQTEGRVMQSPRVLNMVAIEPRSFIQERAGNRSFGISPELLEAHSQVSLSPFPGMPLNLGSLPCHTVNQSTHFLPTTQSTSGLSLLEDLDIPRSTPPLLQDFEFTWLFPLPFSWLKALNWPWIKTLTKHTDIILKSAESLSVGHMALSYQKDLASTICATPDTDINFAQYLVTMLLNNMQPTSTLKLEDIHIWLQRLPQSIVLQFLKVLPPGHSDVLQERMFVVAMRQGDLVAIQSVLETGFDIYQAIDCEESKDPKLPLVHASRRCDYPVARTILTHASRKASPERLDNLLVQIVTAFGTHDHYHPDVPRACSAFRWSELLNILIDAGAKPTLWCLEVAMGGDAKLVKRILSHFQEGAQGWFEAGVVQHCLPWRSCPNLRYTLSSVSFDANPHIRLIYSHILQERLREIQSHTPASIAALRKAFRSAIDKSCTWAVDIILGAALHLRISLGSLAHDDVTNASIVSAHHNSDWALLAKLTKWENEDNHTTPQHTLRRPDGHETLSYESLVSDWSLLMSRLNSYKLRPEAINKHYILLLLASGCSPNFENVLVALALNYDRERVLGRDGIRNLLKRGKTTVISQLMLQQDAWKYAVLCSGSQHDFDALDDLIYRSDIRSDSRFFNVLVSIADEEDEINELLLRVTAYHAIETNDDILLTWALKAGLPVGEGTPYLLNAPSLLSVAVSQDNAKMTKVLLNQETARKDSNALAWAVAGNVDIVIIHMLLAAVDLTQRRENYGGAALRASILRKNYETLCFLSSMVDLNSIEPLTFEECGGHWVKSLPLSPMGEAIFQRDLKAADILIKKGANVCGLVMSKHYYKFFPRWQDKGTSMNRANNLLAAIDTEYLPMVKLLVDHGADLNHSFRIGLVRTPIQRAAEIGNFEIVQYLLENGAYVDSAPCYSGGTPLQLTAIGGYVGIAELLLEHDADVNHLPAKGKGRTAFEGAAEWGRVDMLSLLVSRGLNFDLVVDEEGHTQYERAQAFAEKRGYMAVKRFVQRLREGSGFDVFNLDAVMGE